MIQCISILLSKYHPSKWLKMLEIGCHYVWGRIGIYLALKKCHYRRIAEGFMNKRGFTLIELLIVIAIIGIIAAIAIPNMLMAMQRSRQKGTILVMHNIATGLESYKAESSQEDFAANVPTIAGPVIDAGSASFVVPIHINVQPNIDRWGNQFTYNAQALGEWMVWFSSPGKNTAREAGAGNIGEYQVSQLSDFDADIIFMDGWMTYGPNTSGAST
jgi:prepilin-type N-terminal cleavage/methylation domain-containing protein